MDNALRNELPVPNKVSSLSWRTELPVLTAYIFPWEEPLPSSVELGAEAGDHLSCSDTPFLGVGYWVRMVTPLVRNLCFMDGQLGLSIFSVQVPEIELPYMWGLVGGEGLLVSHSCLPGLEFLQNGAEAGAGGERCQQPCVPIQGSVAPVVPVWHRTSVTLSCLVRMGVACGSYVTDACCSHLHLVYFLEKMFFHLLYALRTISKDIKWLLV